MSKKHQFALPEVFENKNISWHTDLLLLTVSKSTNEILSPEIYMSNNIRFILGIQVQDKVCFSKKYNTHFCCITTKMELSILKMQEDCGYCYITLNNCLHFFCLCFRYEFRQILTDRKTETEPDGKIYFQFFLCKYSRNCVTM